MAFPPITKAELLELWRRLFPPGYTAPIELEREGMGLDLFAQQAAQFERVADAANTTQQAYYLRPHSTQTAPPAGGEIKAFGEVLILRAAPAIGPITLIAGTQFRARFTAPSGDVVDGSLYEVTEDTLIASGVLGPVTVPVRCTRPGYQGNVAPEHVVAFEDRGQSSVVCTVTVGALDANELRDTGRPDVFTPAMIGQYVRLLGPNLGAVPRRILNVTQAPVNVAIVDGPALTVTAVDAELAEVEEFGELGLTVTQPSPIAGGRHGFLDAIARDRGTSRFLDEDDTALRLRLGSIDDTISPAAILRAAARALTPYGIGFRLLETRDVSSLPGFIFDLPPSLAPGLVGAWDFGDLTNGFVLLDTRDSVTFFVLLVGGSSLGEFGAPYDSPYPDNAWDLLFFDGFPLVWASALRGLYDAIERSRAAGVGWVLAFDPTL